MYCRAIAEANVPENDPRTDPLLSNLAQLPQATNQLGEAEPPTRTLIQDSGVPRKALAPTEKQILCASAPLW